MLLRFGAERECREVVEALTKRTANIALQGLHSEPIL